MISQPGKYYFTPIKIFGLNASQKYAAEVADHLDMKLTPHDEKLFQDGEIYIKSADGEEGNVRGHDVYVIQSLYSDQNESVNDKLVKLCIMIGSLKAASAERVTAVIPHLAYARQDRKTESRAPVTTKIVAKMLEAVGADRVLLFDVHNLAAEQNAFSIPIDNLEAKNLFAEWVKEHYDGENLTILSPDAGGYSRASRFRTTLSRTMNMEIGIAILDKLRIKGVAQGGRIVGDVEGTDVIIFDDMISTGGTMCKAVEAIVAHKGNPWVICATHGLFVGKANDYFADLDTRLVVADTVSMFRVNDTNRKKLSVVKSTKMMARAIERIHSGTGSISSLLR